MNPFSLSVDELEKKARAYVVALSCLTPKARLAGIPELIYPR